MLSAKASALTSLFKVSKYGNSLVIKSKNTKALLTSRWLSASTVNDASSSVGEGPAKKMQSGEPTPLSPPKLFEVPALPFVGSLITMHSGHSLPSQDQPYLHLPSNRKKYGDFYSLVSSTGDRHHLS
jgi:hypothetical protein